MLSAEFARQSAINPAAATWATGRRGRLQFPKLVYFVQIETGPIKIGTSDIVSFKGRLEGLQNGSPHPLRVLATIAGDRSLERDLHEQLAAYRIRGEWFLDCDAVRNVMNELVQEHRIEALL